MPPKSKKVSPETALARKMLNAARETPTDKGMAACIPYAHIYERLAVTTRPDPDDLDEAQRICRSCPLLAFCPVAITTPGG